MVPAERGQGAESWESSRGRAWRGGLGRPQVWPCSGFIFIPRAGGRSEESPYSHQVCCPPPLVQALLSARSSPSSPTGFLPCSPAPKGLLAASLSLVPSSHPSICHQRQLSAWASGVLIRVSAPRPPGIFPLSSPQSSCCCDFPGLPVRATTAPACFDITRSPWQLSLS